jgi:predicted ATPase
VYRAVAAGDAFVPGDVTAFEDALRDRALLIVLDNCEHVVDAAAAIVRRIISASAASRVLSTSRVPLRVAGEVTWRLEPLDVDTQAPRMLLDRIHAARPEIDAGRLPRIDIERICHALDGVPLALELTAARLRTMSLREVADQLAGHMDTMARALRWSVDLLSDEERRMFYRLSVFRDGFDSESARAVCGPDAARCISKFADASLIVPPQPDAQDERYRILESVRQLAWSALQEADDVDNARAAHATYFAQRFIALDEDLRHARSNVYFNLLERDYQNVRAALEWLLGGADPQTGINLALAISRYWFDRGLAHEARAWMERALQFENVDALLRARVLQCLATVCRNSGDYAEHFALIGQAVEQLRAGGADAATIGKALAVQSNGARILGDFETSRRLAAQAIQSFEPLNDPYLLAFAHTCIAVTLYSEGRLEDAEAEFMKIFDEFEACHAENDAVLTLVNLGICRLYAGDFDVALARLNAALPRAVSLKHRYAEAWTRVALAIVFTLAGHQEEALEELPRAVRLARAIDDKEQLINCIETAAMLCTDENPKVAAQALSCAERARERFHLPHLPVELALHERMRAAIAAKLDAPALAIAREEGRFTPLDAWLDRIERGQYNVQVGLPSQKSTL